MNAASLILLTIALAAKLEPQSQPPIDQVTSKEFLTQLLHDSVYLFISSSVAESLLLHRVEPVVPHGDSIPRVSGTVIVAFELTKEGKIRHAMAVSGPRLLQQAALSAVRQWKFRPYDLGGRPTTVATSISLTISNF
jgi:protein TonB